MLQAGDRGAEETEPVQAFSGKLTVVNGRIHSDAVTVLHNRSIGEDILVSRTSGPASEPMTGELSVEDGRIVDTGITLTGRSLLHSVPLTVEAFKRSFMGDFGQYAVTIGLVLFAFSTAISWSYYGDRAMTYLFGVRTVMPYRVIYVIGFFLAAIVDTTLVWLISAVTLALMTLPNLLGLMLMRKEIRAMTKDYWLRAKRNELTDG